MAALQRIDSLSSCLLRSSPPERRPVLKATISRASIHAFDHDALESCFDESNRWSCVNLAVPPKSHKPPTLVVASLLAFSGKKDTQSSLKSSRTRLHY